MTLVAQIKLQDKLRHKMRSQGKIISQVQDLQMDQANTPMYLRFNSPSQGLKLKGKSSSRYYNILLIYWRIED
jgi:hypothetical protein